MKAVLNPPAFPLLDDLWSADWLKTFEEILSSAVDKDKDYRHLMDQGIRSSSYRESLGPTLSGQPITVLADLTAEFEKESRQMYRDVEPIKEEKDLDSGTKAIPDSKVALEGEGSKG